MGRPLDVPNGVLVTSHGCDGPLGGAEHSQVEDPDDSVDARGGYYRVPVAVPVVCESFGGRVRGDGLLGRYGCLHGGVDGCAEGEVVGCRRWSAQVKDSQLRVGRYGGDDGRRVR